MPFYSSIPFHGSGLWQAAPITYVAKQDRGLQFFYPSALMLTKISRAAVNYIPWKPCLPPKGKCSAVQSLMFCLRPRDLLRGVSVQYNQLCVRLVVILFGLVNRQCRPLSEVIA